MFDGIGLTVAIANYYEWRKSIDLVFNLTISENAEVKSNRIRANKKKPEIERTTIKKECKFGHYSLVIFETEIHYTKTGKRTKIYRLNIYGSLHKNHHGGSNYKPFRYWQVINEIRQLCLKLNLDPKKVKIEYLEIGLNLPVWFKPFDFLEDYLLCYQFHFLSQWDEDEKGKTIGYHWSKKGADRWIKIYDKGLQFNLNENLLRFEIKVKKMRDLQKYGIKTLADLTDQIKVKQLLSVLEKAWSDVLIYDIDEIPPSITMSQKRFLENCSSKDNWHKWNKESNQKFRDAKRRFKLLSEKHGSGTHAKILELIRSEWKKRFEFSTDFTEYKNTNLTSDPTDFTNTVKGDIREPSLLQSEVKRFCQSCGKDISNQKRGSKFCSETIFGPDAKKCRNKDSNPRNNQKKKIDRFNRIGPTLFDVRPFLTNR
jgi:hypothetical protein